MAEFKRRLRVKHIHYPELRHGDVVTVRDNVWTYVNWDNGQKTVEHKDDLETVNDH